MKILLTNDDGVHASGILELAKLLLQKHQVFMVAPRIEQSGISQAITFLRPLFPVALGGDSESDSHVPGFSVDGTPTDCVKLALEHLCPFRPDLIISGINNGFNIGVNCCFSGTVGGALAAAQFDIPAMAFSLQLVEEMDYPRAAELAVSMVDRFFVEPWPEKVALNINFPTRALTQPADIRVVPKETNPLGYHYDEGRDPKGRLFYWANAKPDPVPSPFPTDAAVIQAGHISVTPLTFNLNQAEAIKAFNDALQNKSTSS